MKRSFDFYYQHLLVIFVGFLFIKGKQVIAVDTPNNVLPEFPKCGLSAGISELASGDASLKEYPWVAVFEYQSEDGPKIYCSGSLINRRYILTSAHCVSKGLLKFHNLTNIRLGEHNTVEDFDCENGACSEAITNVGAEDIIVHKEYSGDDYQNNIALIRLNVNVKFSDQIQPICIPSSVPNFKVSNAGKMVYVTGWGHTEFFGITHHRKQRLVLPISDHSECAKNYMEYIIDITQSQICAGTIGKPDACLGFSGAPLMQKVGESWVLEGIYSYGISCAEARTPGVYTKVSSYDEWIKSNLKL